MNLVPPFDADTARLKVRAAQDAWNTRDPLRVAAAYTPDSVWRNRSEFVRGTDEIVEFLTRKWEREHDYVLRKSLWAFGDSRIAVGSSTSGATTTASGGAATATRTGSSTPSGYMWRREASINDVRI